VLQCSPDIGIDAEIDAATLSVMDGRFLLANERTFLAYLRTALALQVGGLAVLQFLTDAAVEVRTVLGLLMVCVGSALGVVGLVRYRRVDAAMRAGEDVPALRGTAMATTALVAAVPLVAAILLSFL